MRALGVDLSLTETGLACPEHGARRIPTGKLRGAERLNLIGREIEEHFDCADVVVLENYGYLKAAAIAVIEAHGVVKLAAWAHGIPVAIVPFASLKKYSTGKGNADKAAMMAAAIRSFDYPGDNENEADAWCLKAMGEAAYGDRTGLAQYRLEAIQNIDWPKVSVPA